ncbi:hypothetical protein KIN20_031030 [Parelaphostrongylus tenuis]|uniref:Uncharacterized protein n=1 Tax=Parelaphostrongylus tenuis TaxID=148309 RepID=A0AAD5WGX8_PARTN|nr:hypothetical protein KIN20_031030 [Parelaphostrongylus tenuis]
MIILLNKLRESKEAASNVFMRNVPTHTHWTMPNQGITHSLMRLQAKSKGPQCMINNIVNHYTGNALTTP